LSVFRWVSLGSSARTSEHTLPPLENGRVSSFEFNLWLLRDGRLNVWRQVSFWSTSTALDRRVPGQSALNVTRCWDRVRLARWKGTKIILVTLIGLVTGKIFIFFTLQKFLFNVFLHRFDRQIPINWWKLKVNFVWWHDIGLQSVDMHK
jgi:hypothetical protein